MGPPATPVDLRLAFKVRLLELQTDAAPKDQVQAVERAFNLLGHPELRSCYQALLLDREAPALFPYGGFGALLTARELSPDRETFFASYALAYIGLADSYNSLAAYDLIPPEQARPKAMEAAMKALAIDEGLAEPHASLGLIKLNYDWDWPAAEREFKRAVEVDPRYHPAHLWYAHYFLMMGRFDEAIAEFKRAEQIDPLSLIGNTNYGVALAFKGQHDRALEQYRKVIELEPGWWSDYLGHAYAKSGKKDEAVRILDELKRTARPRPMSVRVARILAGLGDYTKAIRWLERGYANRESGMIGLKVDPAFKELRKNSRFARLLRRMEFE